MVLWMLILFLILTRWPNLANVEKPFALEPLLYVLRALGREWTREDNEKLLTRLLIEARHHSHRQTVVFKPIGDILRGGLSLKSSHPEIHRRARTRAILSRCFIFKFDVRENDRHGRLCIHRRW